MKKIILTLLLLQVVFIANAQLKVGGNPTTINSNSVLELESSNKGLLLPRVALEATNSPSPLSSFVAGMIVYNTATSGDVLPGFYVASSTRWSKIDDPNNTYTGSTSVTLNGTSFERAALTGDVTAAANSNATTISNSAVTYAKMQNVSANNRILGRATTGAGTVEEITLGSGLTLSGTTLSASSDLRLVNTSSHITQDAGVGSNGTTAGATESIMIGQGTGNSNSGGRNIFIGQEAGYANTTPTELVFIGYKAGRANTTGTKNVFIGSTNGYQITTGSNNTAVGHNNLLSNTTGGLNSAFGSGALAYNTSSNNTAIGANAMVFNTGTGNTALGALAMVNGNSGGSFNTALGSEAGYSLTGTSNTLVGFRAGSNLTSGNRNILIGETIQPQSNTGSNQLSIGNLIFGTGVDGSGTTLSSGNIGIGVAAPSEKLDVAGNIKFSGALMPNNTAGTAGQVLTSAGAGAVPTWTTLPTATTYTGSTSVTLNGTSFERAALTGDVTATANSNATTIATGAVTSSKILDGTIATADVANSAITGAKLENNIVLPGTESMTLPSGTTAQRPTTAVAGMSRYNTTDNIMEYYNGTAWIRPTAGTTYTGSTSTVLNGTSFERAALTGDVTAAQNSNALTIANDAVTSAKILDGTVATADVANSAVTYAKIQNVSANNRILGRATTGAGTVEEITLGSGLTLTGTTLSASGDLRLVNTTSHITQDAGVGSNGTSAGAGEVIAIGTGAGNSNSAVGSVFIGHQAGNSNTNGSGNSFVGYQSGRLHTTGPMNTYFGYQAGENSTNGNDNTYMGYRAGRNSGNGVFWNTYVGSKAGEANTSGVANAAFGAEALKSNNGNGNAAFGAGALSANTSGGENAVFGRGALPNNTTGSTNAVLGSVALYWSSTGSNNVAVGGGSGYQTTTGSNNTFIGYNSGSNNTSGSGNIVIGNSAMAPSVTASNQLSIGNLIYGTDVDGSGTTISSGNIGIGVAAPSQKLEVAGAIRFSGALMPNNTAGTAGQVLTSAGAGNVPTWTTISAGTTYTGSTSVTLNGTSFERAALTGDVTAATNSNALTIANDAVTTAKILDGTIATADVANSAVTYAKIQNVSANNRILGRATTGAGTVEEITLGTGLSLSGTTLNAASATTLYNGDGSLSGNRTVTQGANTLSFTSTATNGFSVDGGTFSVDAANNRIGLGTTSPVDALHVEATGGKRLVFSNSGGIANNEDIGGITWRQDDGTGTIMGNIVIQGNSGSTGDGSSRMIIGTRANLAGTGLVETMSIHSNGNVGINTGSAAPTEKLHVVGNIRSSSLAGTGSRMVVADANGVMSTTAIPTATNYSGSTSVALNGTSFERAALTGDVTAAQNSNALTISNDAVTSAKILDGTVATADVANSAVTYAKIQNVSANNRILGRATTGAGTVEEITLGSGLSLSGTTLSASGDLRLVNTTSHITQDAGVGSNGTSAGGARNILIGNGAGNANSGTDNVFVGNLAGNSTSIVGGLTFIGSSAGKSHTTGEQNTFIGFSSGENLTNGSQNTALGYQSLKSSVTGYNNTAIGNNSLTSNTNSYNTALGSNSLSQNSDGFGNTAIGSSAMNGSTTGSHNTSIGFYAALNASGSNNVIIGSNSGSNLTTGNRNILIGRNINAPVATGSNQLSIGNLIFGNNVDGDGATISSGNVGIGISNPSEKLDVDGAVKFAGALMPNNSAGTAGQVLTSAGAGSAPTWTTISAGTTYTGSTSVTLNGTSFERAALTGDVTAAANSNALTIANDAVTTAKIADGAITAAKLNQMSATIAQVLKWNGTAWAPAADDNTIADGSETKLTAGSGITITGTGTTASPYVINANSSVATVTADYTATSSNNTILCNVPGAGMTLTLPSASANTGKVIVIRKIDNDRDVLTFSPALNYSTSQTISTLNFVKTITVQSNGTAWWVISE